MANARKEEEWVCERLFGQWKDGLVSDYLVQIFAIKNRSQNGGCEYK